MVAQTPHAARLAALPAPQQHAAVELLRGTMVKHNLIAYRDDHPGASQPITLAEGGWRDYVPCACPGRSRPRTPAAGSVAVSINPAHTFTDIVLPIDADEDRLLGAIDGQRTIREIVAGRARRPSTGAPGPRLLRAPLAARPGRLRRVAPYVHRGLWAATELTS